MKSEKKRENSATENQSNSELNEARWAVVSFESVVLRGATYAAARARLQQLEKEKISGLCVVADEVAARMSPPEN